VEKNENKKMTKVSDHLMRCFQKIPLFRGKKMIVRALFPFIFKQQESCIVDRCGTLFHVPSMEEAQAQHIFIDGDYEIETCKVIACTLRPGSVFFDVGANIGFFSSRGAISVGEGGEVYAFEASPSVAHYLGKNVNLNSFENIKIINSAVSDVVGEINFFQSQLNQCGMSSIAPQSDASPIRLCSTTLDAFVRKENITRVDLIKVDVEGHEAAVFRGALELLQEQAPIIIFEFCDWAEKRAGYGLGESQQILMDCGYRLWDSKNYVRGGPPLKELVRSGFSMIVAKKST